MTTKIQIIDLNDELQKNHASKFKLKELIFSDLVKSKIKEKLARKEQILIFLNRRGTANSLFCTTCKKTIQCPNCDISLTPHHEQLLCHYCNLKTPLTDTCPNCQSTNLIALGLGIQNIELQTKQLFKGAKITRIDSDTLNNKKNITQNFQNLQKQKADIIIGTQVLAKGWDLPNITLVVVLFADFSLYFPDFRASEITYQLLTQVAGRCGRGKKAGEVLIQTLSPQHPAILAVSSGNHEAFIKQELAERKKYFYPPFSHLCKISVSHKSSVTALKQAKKIKQEIQKLGTIKPTHLFFKKAHIHKINNIFSYEIIIKSLNPASALSKLKLPANAKIDIDPLNI